MTNSYNSLSNPPKGRPRQVLLETVFGDHYIGMWIIDHFEIMNEPSLQKARGMITTGRFTAWMEIEDPEIESVGLPSGFIPACNPPKHNNSIILKIGPFDYCIGEWNEEEGKFVGYGFPKNTALWTHVTGWMEIPQFAL